MRVRGRYAPSPTGLIHLGNALAALAAWLSARAQGGAFLWRLEDLDGPRVAPGMAEAAERDLAWLGLDWDEGGGRGGPHAPYRQSERAAFYEAALARLAAADRLFPCARSRKDLAGAASAPHGPGGAPYPARLRPADLPSGWYAALRPGAAALRFKVDAAPVHFTDRVFGRIAERVDRTVGDFVLRRRDGCYAYQLAVTVDDLAMGVTEVVRGADLLASTARQAQLIRALGAEPPAYAHVPLVLGPDGAKLSKRDNGLALGSLREAGARPEQVTGYLAWMLGLLEQPRACTPAELAPGFAWGRLRRANIQLAPGAADAVRRVP